MRQVLPLIRSPRHDGDVDAEYGDVSAVGSLRPSRSRRRLPWQDLQALAASIEDETKRKELLATIRALIAAKEGGEAAEAPRPLSERIVAYTTEAVHAAEEATGDLSVYFRDWPLVVEWIRREISDPVARAKGLNNAAAFVAIFAVGWLAEYLLWRILADTRRRIDHASKRSGPARILPIITRAACGFAAAAGIRRRRVWHRAACPAEPRWCGRSG